MEEFLDKLCFIKVDNGGKPYYYTRAYVVSITQTHITFLDRNKSDEPHTFRIVDIIEIKLSNKENE